MPRRRRDDELNANLTLLQTLYWIAFDNTEGAAPHPEELRLQITGNVENLESLEYEHFVRKQDLEEAEIDLFAALRDGDIQSQGRFSDQYLQRVDDWTKRSYDGHSETRSVIPAEFWWRDGIDWGANRAKSPHGEFADIILISENVISLWNLDESIDEEEVEASDEDPAVESGNKRGPKYRFSRDEFYALCVWEAATNDIFDKSQAEFVKQMEELLAVVWGEDKVPGSTWLKEMISPIYKCRKKYESARQQIQGIPITDQSETNE